MSVKVEAAFGDRSGRGYRLSVSSRRPGGRVDAWVPELAPSHALRRLFRLGACSWRAFVDSYKRELSGALAQEALKPLALLSRRRALVVCCDCLQKRRCHHGALAEALERCRRSGRFALAAPCGPSTRWRTWLAAAVTSLAPRRPGMP